MTYVYPFLFMLIIAGAGIICSVGVVAFFAHLERRVIREMIVKITQAYNQPKLACYRCFEQHASPCTR